MSQIPNCPIYLDILISIIMYNYSSKYVTEVYDKRDAFNFNIVNFPYMSSNIPANLTYGVYISQLIRISQSFVIRHSRGVQFFLLELFLQPQMEHWGCTYHLPRLTSYT